MNRTTRLLLAATATLPLVMVSAPAPSAFAQAVPAADAPAPATFSVATRIAEEARASREALVGEAKDAWDATSDALEALERPTPDTEEALGEIREALGTVEVLLARDPGMGEVPVAVRTTREDSKLNAKQVRERIEQAEDALDDGELQEARRLIEGLGSAVTITTVKVNMNTWPEHLRSAAASLDGGDLDAARSSLQEALSSTVSYDRVVPLSPLRAAHAFQDASALAIQAASQPGDAAEGTRERIDTILDQAMIQLHAGEAFSYYGDDAVGEIAAVVAEIRDRVADGDAAVAEFSEAQRLVAGLG